MIRLHKDNRELLVRIDLDAAPSAIERLWSAYETTARLVQRSHTPEALELLRITHGAVLLLVTQLLADTCTEKAAECRDRADNPETDEPSVVH